MNSTKMSPSGRPMLVAQYAMEKTLAVKPKEQIMILADTEADSDLVHAFASVANIMGAEPTILIMPPAFLEMEKYPPRVALKALEAADIYIPMTPTTGHSVHCLEVADLYFNKKSFRWLIVGGYHGGQMDAMLDAFRNHDYENVFNITKKLAEIIDKGEKVRITSKLGTDLTASIKNIPCRIAGGIAREPGTSACVPDGEAYSGPAEGTGEGVVVIDGPISQICEKPMGPSEPVKLTFKKGRLTHIEGGFEAEKLKEIVRKYDNADNLAEVSVGTNPYIRLNGNINSNDKKKWGTMHIALGQNVFQIFPYGTIDSPIHMDAMMLEPTCEVDGKIIVENGKIVV